MKKIAITLLSLALSSHAGIQESLIAAAYGDALGRVTEFIPSLDALFKKYPQGVRSFRDFTHADRSVPRFKQENKQFTLPFTDDTAMAILVLKQLILTQQDDVDLEQTMSGIAKNFIDDTYQPHGWNAKFRAPGICCMKYVHALEEAINNPHPGWWRVSPANGKTGGCGSVMRAYPFGFLFQHDPEKAKVWAAEHSILTHGDHSAQAACAAMAIGIAYALQQAPHHTIIQEMIAAAREYDAVTAYKMEDAFNKAMNIKARYADQSVSFFTLLCDKKSSYRQEHEALFTTYAGWSAQDAIAGVIYLFTLLPHNPYEAILLGVHTPGDSDSIASLAGALSGAYTSTLTLPAGDAALLEGYETLCKLAEQIS